MVQQWTWVHLAASAPWNLPQSQWSWPLSPNIYQPLFSPNICYWKARSPPGSTSIWGSVDHFHQIVTRFFRQILHRYVHQICVQNIIGVHFIVGWILIRWTLVSWSLLINPDEKQGLVFGKILILHVKLWLSGLVYFCLCLCLCLCLLSLSLSFVLSLVRS